MPSEIIRQAFLNKLTNNILKLSKRNFANRNLLVSFSNGKYGFETVLIPFPAT